MKFDFLIDNIVRQTTVLIAQLATVAGVRAPLAHVSAQVFLSLVQELKAQGLGNKVIADMFGLALRTYHNRVRRYSESATERGTSLWEAALTYVQQRGVTTRAELLRRFHADDAETVRAVLKDLVDSGLLFRSGREDRTTFRAAQPDDLLATSGPDPELATANLIWVVLHQSGPQTVDDLTTQLNLSPARVQATLLTLTKEGRVRLEPDTAESKADGAPSTARYVADSCVIPYGDELGWEAAVFDHYQAMVAAIANKLRSGRMRAKHDEWVGGSTYHFDLYAGHPLEQQALGFLQDVRERASRLREAINAQRRSDLPNYRVVFYAGQNMIGERDPQNEGDEE